MSNLKELIEEFLEENVMPATGCTEPVAVTYNAAVGYRLLKKKEKNLVPEDINVNVSVDRDTYKNAKSVIIPNTNGNSGLEIAAALGMYTDPEESLNLLGGITGPKLKDAKNISENIVINEVKENGHKANLDILVNLSYNGSRVSVRTKGRHTNISEIIYNEKNLDVSKNAPELMKKKYDLSINKIIEIADNLDINDTKLVDKLYEGIDMNLKMAEEGLQIDLKRPDGSTKVDHTYGLGLGKALQKEYGFEGEYLSEMLPFAKSEDKYDLVEIMSAAAGDARMGGANRPVMSTAGSGNQGITALVPIGVMGEIYGKSKLEQAKAALVSHLVTKYSAEHSGNLSAMCGCAIKAGVGSAAGVAYLMSNEDKEEKVNHAINYLASNLTGILCDGAKPGCATKLSTASREAAKAGVLAAKGMVVDDKNGIIYSSADNTIAGIGRISDTLVRTDYTIVKIMEDK